jgi:protein TonB
MFQQTFVDSVQPTKKQYTVTMSLLLQIVVVGVLTLLPLVYTAVLPGAQLRSLLVAPAPPRPKVIVHQVSSNPPVVRAPLNAMVAPISIPHTVAQVDRAAPDIGVEGSVGNPGIENGIPPSLIGAMPVERPYVAPAVPDIAKAQQSGPVRVGGAVAESRVIHRVVPLYPPIAQSIRVEGVVEFSATISKEGNIENLQLIHGHPLLAKAAEAAVLQWKYQPTLLNGRPVEVITDIVVNFRLNR